MASIEDLVRDSLRQRAQDVEPTPALWLEVDRRVTRRRRFQVVAWSLGGVAAVLAALAVIPGLLVGSGDTGLEIEPMDRLPVTGVVPGTAVVADGGELSLFDIDAGRSRSTLFEGEGEIVQVEVRPGSSDADYDLAAVRVGVDGAAELLLASSVDGELSSVSGRLQEHAVAPGFVPSIAWAPEGRHLLYTVPGAAGQATVLAEDVALSRGTFLDAARASTLTTVGSEARILDWIGAAGQPGDTSLVLLRGGDGQIVAAEVVVADDGAFVSGDVRPQPMRLDGIFDVAGAHTTTSIADAEQYLLARNPEGVPLFAWVGDGPDGAEVIEFALREAGVDVGAEDQDLWLSAKQDAALIGDGERVWLLAHDGGGDFAPAVELPATATTGAMFDAVRPGAGEDPDGEDTTVDPDPDPDPPSQPGTAPEVAGAELPAPVVTVSAQDLTLISPDGPVSLASLPDEGESRFLSARVRPGSTIDDLTIVALTTAEGMYDLRTLRVVDGEVTSFEPFPTRYVPGMSSPAGEGVSIRGPVWSPDGLHLAWFEFGTGPATLRTIGWDEGPGTGDTATDNAVFTLEDLPTQPIEPMEWVELPGIPRMTEIRAAWGDFDQGWFAIPLEIQADDALAQPAGGPDVIVRAGADGGLTFALASAPGTAEIRFMVQDTPSGFELVVDPFGEQTRTLLPEAVEPGDGIPSFWARAIGDGALVGSPNTSLAWFVTADQTLYRLQGSVIDADVVD